MGYLTEYHSGWYLYRLQVLNPASEATVRVVLYEYMRSVQK